MKYLLPLFLLIFVPSHASHALDASYEGEELILLERHPITETRETVCRYDYPLSTPAFSIYLNPATTNYYFVEDGAGMTKLMD